MDKVIVIKLNELGSAPYYAEYYEYYEDIVGTVYARNGGIHDYGRRVRGYKRKPYKTTYLSERMYEQLVQSGRYTIETI